MILDQAAYKRLRVAEERRAWSSLSAAETIAIGEALWTSALAGQFHREQEPRGENAVRRLRVHADRPASKATVGQ